MLWLEDKCQESDQCPEQYPGHQPGWFSSVWIPCWSKRPWRGWPSADCSFLLGWTAAGSCSAPSTPPHQYSPVLRRRVQSSHQHNFPQFYFTFASTAANINPEMGQKSLPECVVSEACGKSNYCLHQNQQTQGCGKNEMLEKQDIT